jgi:pantoate--beta-alanine ligase
MGALHRGHAALIEEARRRAGFVAVSVFVNPTQFGPNEDFARYPRTLDADVDKCKAAGASIVFAPAADAMYPSGEETRVHVGATAEPLCGAHRPGHFEGVTTIVAKLFALTGPCVAVFGRKDYQQLKVLTRMAADLFLPVEVVGLRTVREPDGLALSSRNRYLTPPERTLAPLLYEQMRQAAAAIRAGAAVTDALAAGDARLREAGFAPDYFALVEATSLAALTVAQPGARLIAAARLGAIRLLDNIAIDHS